MTTTEESKTTAQKAMDTASLNFDLGVWDTNCGLEYIKKVQNNEVSEETVNLHYDAAKGEKARRDYYNSPRYKRLRKERIMRRLNKS